jgi:hypothetical protein
MLNNKASKDTKITFYRAMVYLCLRVNSNFGPWKTGKNGIAQIKFSKIVARYANTNIKEKLNIFVLNNVILKSRSQCIYSWKNSGVKRTKVKVVPVLN